MKKLTIVMPFLNEGYEPVNTIMSINNTANPDEIEIIAICDAPEYEYENKLRQFSNVTFIKNQYTIGVDASRSVGINLAKTDAVLIIDAHMRFSHDDWVNKIWIAVQESPKTLWCTRGIVLHDTMTEEELNPLRDVLDVSRHYSVGAILHYFENSSKVPFHLKWSMNSSFLTKTDGFLSCVLGANYAGSSDWLRHIRSFEGMMSWGFSEQYISVKNWLLGGDCRGLDTVSIGHIFRSRAPYVTPYKYHLYNMIFTAYTLFSDELDICNNYINLLKTSSEFTEANKMIEARWDIVQTYRQYFLQYKTTKLSEYLDRFNIQYREIVYGNDE
jgi:glycosyltransferase involved in cell wall biosynthesis